jgi:hypothetical protein
MTDRATASKRSAAWALLACLLLVAAPAHAATLSTPPLTTINGVGATSPVLLSIDNAMGVEAADIDVTLPSVAQLSGDVTTTTISSNCTVLSNASGGVVRIGLACAAPLSGSGPLLSIPLSGVSTGSGAITISRCELNELNIPCQLQSTPGQVAVSTPTPTSTRTSTSTVTRTATATPTPTRTFTRTATNTATLAPTRTATPTPFVRLDPIPSPIVVGASHSLPGAGFTAGSVIQIFIATSSGSVSQGPFTPTARTANSLTWSVPASMPLGNGFASVMVINTDQGYIQSNLQSQLLQGSAAANIPTIRSVNGVNVHAVDATVPLAYVETVVAPGATVSVGGTGFNAPLINLFTASGNLGPLSPLAGGNATTFQITIPANAPTGPGSLQVVNNPYTGNVLSNAVSVPIGALVTITSVSQSGNVITVDGTGFSTVSVINLFAQQAGGGVTNFGGLNSGGGSKIPLSVQSSTRFTFNVPAGAASGAAYVMVLNPPYIPYSTSGSDPDGAFTLSVP